MISTTTMYLLDNKGPKIPAKKRVVVFFIILRVLNRYYFHRDEKKYLNLYTFRLPYCHQAPSVVIASHC
jgi:hypothetical protein